MQLGSLTVTIQHPLICLVTVWAISELIEAVICVTIFNCSFLMVFTFMHYKPQWVAQVAIGIGMNCKPKHPSSKFGNLLGPGRKREIYCKSPTQRGWPPAFDWTGEGNSRCVHMPARIPHPVEPKKKKRKNSYAFWVLLVGIALVFSGVMMLFSKEIEPYFLLSVCLCYHTSSIICGILVIE